jgi:hypothetical protein
VDLRIAKGIQGSLALAALCLAAAPAVAGPPAAQATAVVGEVDVAGQAPLEPAGELAERDALATGSDGQCALLVDDDALLEVCENTSLTLDRGDRGHRIVRLDAGAVRLVAEPRTVSERIEVHTPAAIATLLGTIVHIEVDPASGRTTITSAQSRVSVRSSDPGVPGATTVAARERLSIDPGSPPPRKAIPVGEDQLAHLEGCLVDFRRQALRDALDDSVLDVLDRVAQADGGAAHLGGDEPPPLPDPGSDPAAPEDTCTPIDCNEMPDQRGPQGQLYLIDGQP